MFSFFD